MNYLVVSSGGMGSTILQRLITLVLYIENIKVINTHDLVNKVIGLDNEGNITRNFKIQYGQTLPEIENILNKANKKVTLVSRLSKDHIDYRKDENVEKFYTFTKTFFPKIISCERENVFELTLSLAIKAKSEVYNVFSQKDRKSIEQVSEIDERYFVQKLKGYVEYRTWLQKNFAGVKQVTYEDLITNTDAVLSDLTGYKDTLKNYFGLPMADILRLQLNDTNLKENEKQALEMYNNLCKSLVEKDILRVVPMKNSSLHEKRQRIKNFDRCLKIFYQYTRNLDFIDSKKATYDYWHQKPLVIS
tara:strand:- start:72 stop:980 length:909 start_codon:yes stop_codon:yes gene_type:complete